MTQRWRGVASSDTIWLGFERIPPLPCREHTGAGPSRRREHGEGPLQVYSWEMVAQTRGSRADVEKGAGSGSVLKVKPQDFADRLDVVWEGKRRAMKTLTVWGLTIGRMEPTDFHEENGRWVGLGGRSGLGFGLGEWRMSVRTPCHSPSSPQPCFPLLYNRKGNSCPACVSRELRLQ